MRSENPNYSSNNTPLQNEIYYYLVTMRWACPGRAYPDDRAAGLPPRTIIQVPHTPIV